MRVRLVWAALLLTATVACTEKKEESDVEAAPPPVPAKTAAPKLPLAPPVAPTVAPPAAPPVAAAPADPQGAAMSIGLDALYKTNNLPLAIEQFRKVLAMNPSHYGAHYQLAMALERNRDPTAKDMWTKVLALATEIKDEQTIKDAKTHLGQ